MGLVCFFPGRIPEGHGKHQIFIDSNASDDQRQALLKVMNGEEAEPFEDCHNRLLTSAPRIHPVEVMVIYLWVRPFWNTNSCISRAIPTMTPAIM